MRRVLLCLSLALVTIASAREHREQKTQPECWPDGTVMSAWFQNTQKVDVSTLGRQYVITDYGIQKDSTIVQTQALQQLIDRIAQEGGGVMVVPEGTFMTGALFFKQGTHLHVRGKLKGSERIIDYPILQTRIEGETCKYFAALVNADGLDGFTISGQGTIDGNGLQYWQEFWIRRQWNPQCTNKDAQRPRLTYISNSQNVTIQDVRLVNSPFWTNHIYKCHHVRYLDCYIYAPTENIYQPQPKRGAPSSDAIDVDACSDVLINGCFMHVNDDAVVMKGGKGTWADQDKTNGPCERVLIQNCRYGRVHGCLTLGSEAIHCRNIVLRDCYSENTDRVLWLKMRPDTPQHYEYVLVKNVTGHCGRFLFIHPWTQFFKPGDRKDMPLSRCNHIAFENIQMDTKAMYDVKASDKYDLENFTMDGQPLKEITMGQVLEKARRTNDYFMQKYSDPTQPTNVKKIRPSHLWTRAVYYEGLMALYNIDQQQRYLDYVHQWADFHKWTPRNGTKTTDADDQCCEQTYIEYHLLTGKGSLEPTKENLQKQMASGRVDYWTWIDAIQMALPVYIKMYAITKDQAYLDYGMKCYRWSRNTCGGGLWNAKEGLWWRDKDFVPPYKEKDGKNCYWSRGNGWVYAALVRSLELLPKNSKEYKELKKDFVMMSEALLKCQHEDGFWHASLVSDADYPTPEMTGTGLFLYGFAWGIQQGILNDKKYHPACDKAWTALKSCLHTNGFLGWNQGTGKQPSDGQPVTFTSVPDFEDYGTGCYLLGLTEYYKLMVKR